MFLNIIGILLVTLGITVILQSAGMVGVYATYYGKFRRTSWNSFIVSIVTECEKMFWRFRTGTKNWNLQFSLKIQVATYNTVFKSKDNVDSMGSLMLTCTFLLSKL
jgi:hypothetical protein